MPELISHSRVRPMPASHSLMKMLNQSASNRNEAIAATRIATQLSRMLLILPSIKLSRCWWEHIAKGKDAQVRRS